MSKIKSIVNIKNTAMFILLFIFTAAGICEAQNATFKQLYFVTFKNVSLAPSIDSERSDDQASLIFGEIVKVLEEKNDRVKVRSLLSDKEGWASKHFFTSNKGWIEYLKQENLFPAYLVVPTDDKQAMTGLTRVPLIIDDEQKAQMNWEIKGFSFIVNADYLETFKRTEIGKACEELKPDVLFVYDGERFQDIGHEASEYVSDQEEIFQEILAQISDKVQHIWFMRFNEGSIYPSPSSSRPENEEPEKTVRFGDKLEILDWDAARDEVKVRCCTSDSVGWIAGYYLTPNRFEIDYIYDKNLFPKAGIVHQANGNQLITKGTQLKFSDGKLTVDKDSKGFIVIFEGMQNRQENFCNDQGVPFNPSSFAFYVHDGQRFIEVLPAALNLFRQKE